MVETLNEEIVSAECFTWSVQLNPVDTSDGRGVNRDSLMTNERAARFLALLPEKDKNGLDISWIRTEREGRGGGTVTVTIDNRCATIIPNQPIRDKWEYPRKMERFPIKPSYGVRAQVSTCRFF